MTQKKKKLVANIIFYVVIALIYGFVAFLLVIKFNNNSIYLFNTRFDVVLTDSMSEKNENHLDFLEGTSQIQAFDVVSSKKIDDDTEIKEKDIVLFKNPDLNNATVMHRIVTIYEKGDEFIIKNAESSVFNEIKVINLLDLKSSISLSALDVTKIELEVLSPEAYNNTYSFSIGGSYIDSTYVTTQIGDYYSSIVSVERKSSAPMKSVISRKNEDECYVKSISFHYGSNNTITFTSEEYNEDETKDYRKLYNAYYLYETRGDKAKDSDGIFKREQLISKVDGTIPKLGFVVRFLTSIPGIIMLVGLAIIITLGSYLYNKNSDKKDLVQDEQAPTQTERKDDENETQGKNN